jgi:SAM-dependent methyltransferase
MASFFGGKDKSGGTAADNERISRHSSGWGQLLGRLHGEEPLRVLDIGPTSSTNINFITELGHSIYLANLVEDAARSEWLVPNEEGEGTHFDVERFLTTHLDFSGRDFDVVLFWDTADYLPVDLLAPALERIHSVMAPGGELLAMFHSPASAGAPEAAKADFHRYHLTNTNVVDVQRAGDYPMLATYTNRQIERLFEPYQGFHFFLGKDNVREVVVVR